LNPFLAYTKLRALMAHTMRIQETKTKDTEAKMEDAMKSATTLRISALLGGLALAILLPATAHAQAEVAPDNYAISNTETTVSAQPAVAASHVWTPSAAPAAKERVQQASMSTAASPKGLLVRLSAQARDLEAAYVEKLNAILYLESFPIS
jgi:hypothetical protein